MLDRFVLAAVFEPNHGAFSKRHQVAQQKAVGGLDFVLVTFCFFGIASAGRVPGKGQRHIQAAPVIPSPAPFLSSGALCLGSLAVIEKETWIALECVENSAI